MANKFLLTGPQGIGKTQAAARIAALLGLNVIDDWIGSDNLPDDTLAVSNAGLSRLDGWDDVVVFEVASPAALQTLILGLERAAASAAQAA